MFLIKPKARTCCCCCAQSLRAGLGPVERSEAASQTPSTPAAEADTQTDEPPEEPSLPVTEVSNPPPLCGFGIQLSVFLLDDPL